VADAVRGGEINFRRLRGLAADEFVQRGPGAINQEDGAGLGIERFNVAHTVVLLIGPGQLVLLDFAIEVILATCGGDDPDLAVAAHDLAIKVKTRIGRLLKMALAHEPRKILLRLGINGGRIRVGSLGQVNLGLADVEKTQRLALGLAAGLGGGQHVVGQLAKFAGNLGTGTNGSKGFYQGHKATLIKYGFAAAPSR